MMETDTSRRKVLELLLKLGAGASVASALSSCGLGGLKPVANPPLPNVVLVLVDDLAADVMGKDSRFPFLETPNVERLQREGTTFERTFVPTAVCSPSRASFLTGAYAHTHGVRTNDTQDLTDALPNFPDQLKKAGYHTGFVGKWHMNNASSEPRLNFDYWLSFAGQGVYNDPVLNENGREFRASGYVTDVLTDYAVDYIETPRQNPFCLIVSHKAGHLPFRAAPRHAHAFSGAQLPEPPNFAETFAGKPAWQRRYEQCGLARDGWEKCEGVDIPESLPLEPWNPYNNAILTHLRTLLAVDEGLGALFAALEDTGQLDNTVFIFTSDNGFMLGAHRLQDKRVMYEESLRVPLIIRYPKKLEAGRRMFNLVSTLDLAPTILELAKLEPPESMLGASLVPLFEDEMSPWRDRLLYEYFTEARGPGVPSILGVRTERWKYVHYPDLEDDFDELYDLETDPFELHNLIADPGYAATLGELQGALQQQLVDTGLPRSAG
jgi:N-acetylglucosamine-6-sulfatase